jgi:hypothetical protein
MAPRLAFEWLRDDLLAQRLTTFRSRGFASESSQRETGCCVASHTRIPVSSNGGWDRWRTLTNLFPNWWTRQFVGAASHTQPLLAYPPASACMPVAAQIRMRTSRAMAEQRIRIRRLALWPVAEVALHKHLPALCRVHYRREALLLRVLMFCHGRDWTLLYGWYGQV